jgi:hypothetical protein
MQPPMGVPMSDFFNFVNNLETKWDSKFQAQAEEFKKYKTEIKDEIDLNRFMNDYDTAQKINSHISHTNSKILFASGGVGLVGVLITPIPVIGLVGVGIAIASGVNGMAHVAINSEGKIQLSAHDIHLRKIIEGNSGCTLHQAQCALAFWNKKCEEVQEKLDPSPDDDVKIYKENFRNLMPDYYVYSAYVNISFHKLKQS